MWSQRGDLMTTVLYLMSLHTWYVFETFTGDYQIDECQKAKKHIELNFDVEATCISRWGDVLLQDDKLY